MKNHQRLISHTQTPQKRQAITISLPSKTVERLDAPAKRSERSRSNLISLILDSALLLVLCCDPPEI